MAKQVVARASGFSVAVIQAQTSEGVVPGIVLCWQGQETEAMTLATWRELVRQWLDYDGVSSAGIAWWNGLSKDQRREALFDAFEAGGKSVADAYRLHLEKAATV